MRISRNAGQKGCFNGSVVARMLQQSLFSGSEGGKWWEMVDNVTTCSPRHALLLEEWLIEVSTSSPTKRADGSSNEPI